MTNEEWNRKVEFLLNQQAKFDAGMQELKEAQAISEQKFAHAAEANARAAEIAGQAYNAALHNATAIATLADTVTRFITTTEQGFREAFDRMKHSDQRIDVLLNSQILTEESLRETGKQLKDTDKRLRDLTDLFGRHIRKDDRGRNGSEN